MDTSLDGLSGSIVRNPETGSPIRLTHVPRSPAPPAPTLCTETHVQLPDTTCARPSPYAQRHHVPPAKITVHWYLPRFSTHYSFIK